MLEKGKPHRVYPRKTNPEARAAYEKARDAKWEAKWAAEEAAEKRTQDIAEARDAVVEAAKAWAKPTTNADVALKVSDLLLAAVAKLEALEEK